MRPHHLRWPHALLALILLLSSACISSLNGPQISAFLTAPPIQKTIAQQSIPGEFQATDWVQSSQVDFSSGTAQDIIVNNSTGGGLTLGNAETGVFTSTVKRMEPFTAVGSRLTATLPRGSSMALQVRVSPDNTTFGGWQDIDTSDTDSLSARYPVTATPPALANQIAGELLVLPGANLYLQYRLTLHSTSRSATPQVKSVLLTGLNAHNGPTTQQALDLTPKKIDAPPIISRAAWGANEKYRFDANNQEIWKPEYVRPTKFIIHHTVTPNDEANPAETVRLVYYYHAVTLEWGDIGYNYLIDWKGNIYEGRYGGENVVAGHARGYNNGSIGIALLGTFQSQQITPEAEQALVHLIAWKAGLLGIDPVGSSFFVDHDTPNIMGHRDAMPGQTTCPGDALYTELPKIRSEVQDTNATIDIQFTAQPDNAWVGGPNVAVDVRAAATNGVSTIQLFLNESQRLSSNSDSLSFIWDTRAWPEGAHTFKVVVTDKHGLKAEARRVLRVDNTPPAFAGFAFTNGTASVQVQDSGSGLAAGSAQYQVYDGKNWSEWQNAALSGASGSTNPETISVNNVPPTSQQIHFRINDQASITAYSPGFQLNAPAQQNALLSNARAQWYFAEGSTTKGYDTWLLIENPNPVVANVTVSYHKPDGSVINRNYTAGPTSRLSIWVNKEVPDTDLSMVVSADQQVYAERAMYSGHDGHSSTGTPNPAKTWYFAEGYTGSGFDTWLLLFNPNAAAANVRVVYVLDSGKTVEKHYQVLPNARLSIWANKEVPDAQLSFMLDSDLPVVAERSMYFDPKREASHNSAGVSAPARTWYLAEGNTTAPYDTWLLLLNPNGTAAKVKLTYYKSDGSTQSQDVTVGPTSRASIWVNKVLPNTAFSTKVEADQNIVVERSMYFSGSGGHNSFGVSQPGNRWYHPEGSTNPSFDTFFLIMNPNPAPASLRVTFLREDGTTTVRQYTVGPNARFTIWANRELPPIPFSTIIESDQPIVSERSTYFQNNTGGTNADGIRAGP